VAYSLAVKPPVPRLEFLASADVKVAAPCMLGPTSLGERRIVPILSGRFEGRLKAEVLPGGADWQIVGRDGTIHLEARYTLRTDDGALIYVRNQGIRSGPPDVLARLLDEKATPPDPSQYYVRTTPRFETSDPRYEWLNKIIAVGSGARLPEAVLLDFYEVL
jgi:Protein of unknown function (DUF3237)